MDVERFFKERKLRRIEKDLGKSKASLLISEQKLGRAKELFQSDFFDQAVLTAYTSMFHSARALLYKDGVQEKSHYAVYAYLDSKYSRVLPKHLINSFLIHQNKRKEILYGFEYDISKDDAESSIVDAEDFLQEAKKIGKL